MHGTWVSCSVVRLTFEIPVNIRSDFHLTATLMRSRDPNAEFADMAGKALTVEWLVENALALFDKADSPASEKANLSS